MPQATDFSLGGSEGAKFMVEQEAAPLSVEVVNASGSAISLFLPCFVMMH